LNIEEYISTGVLELYVLGDLPEQEAAEVERMAAAHPRVRQELASIEKTLEGFANSFAKTPPASLKGKILGQIEKESIRVEKQFGEEEAKIIPLQADEASTRFRISPYFVAASVALAILFAFTTFHYRSKWLNSEGKLVAIQQDNLEMASNFNKVRSDLEFELQNHKQFLEAIRDPD
jgi:hypothetical protein